MWKTLKRWFGIGGPVDIGLRIAYVYGLPAGITVGAIFGALKGVNGDDNSAAWGVLVGAGTAIVIGTAAALIRGRLYMLTRWKGTYSQSPSKLDETFNVAAATHRYVMIRKEENYIVYGSTMDLPVAAGPLTMSGEYKVVMVQISDTEVMLTGPRWIVSELAAAAVARGVTAIPLE